MKKEETTKEIELEIKKENFVFLNLINKNLMLQNTKLFNEIYPPIVRTSTLEIDRSKELTKKNKEYFDSLEKKRKKFQKKFLVLNSKKGDKKS